MTGLLVAARYLTIVPLPGAGPGRADSLGRAAVWFPAIGLGIGAVLVGAERVTAVLFPSLLAALLTVTAWKLLTGGLHLDGLADCLDGLAGRDAEHRLAIMRDSRIGAFGAIGLILFLLLEVVAVAELPPGSRGRALLVVPVIARATPPLLALHAVAVPVFAVSVLSALALTRFFAARVSGITGDVLGAAIEVAELAGLLTVSAWAHLVR